MAGHADGAGLRAGRLSCVRGSTAWGVVAVAVAASLIGTIGTAAELGPDSVSPFATGAWRGVIGATGLLVVSTLRGQAPWRYRLPMRWVALGGLGVAASQLLFFEAMARTGVAVGTLVAIGVGPLVAGLIDWIAYRLQPDGRWLAGVAVALGEWCCCRAGLRTWCGAAWPSRWRPARASPARGSRSSSW